MYNSFVVLRQNFISLLQETTSSNNDFDQEVGNYCYV